MLVQLSLEVLEAETTLRQRLACVDALVLVAVGVGEEEVPVVLGTSMMVPNLMFAKVFLTGEQLARVFRPISLVLVVVASSLLGAWCLGSLLCSKFLGG